ncbi:MAG: carbohydrate kinase family protein [Anaerolineales bacterium]|nr:MAG: carbohydrate kinase family protein [Anaerolineales bacterium]
MSEAYDAVVAGHLCLDMIPDMGGTTQDRIEQVFSPGRLSIVGAATFCTGGPVSNTGLALTKLGIQTQLMGKVGDDVLGQAVSGIVSSYGPHLADGMVVDPEVNTSYTIVFSPPGVDRFFLHYPGANDTFSADDVRYDLVSDVRLFHFGYPPIMRLMFRNDGDQLVEVFRRAKETGATTSLDMALPDPSSAAGRADWVTILKKTLPYVDVFLPSIEEILYMLDRGTYDELYRAAKGPGFLPLITPELLSGMSHKLIEMGVKIVALKLGDRGLYLRTADQSAIEAMGKACPSDPAAWADQELWTTCFQVEVVGTAGSGDATIAGFLSALLRDLSPGEAVTAAVAVGACNVEASDTLSGVRPWDETLRRVASGWARHRQNLDAPGWRFDEARQLWVGQGRS